MNFIISSMLQESAANGEPVALEVFFCLVVLLFCLVRDKPVFLFLVGMLK